MSDNMYGLAWEHLKGFFSWLFVIAIFVWILWALCQPANTVETINGHEYIRHIGYHSDDIEHSPDCWCFKQAQP